MYILLKRQTTSRCLSCSNQGWQGQFSTGVNFCSRNGLLKLEVEEDAGRHLGLYPQLSSGLSRTAKQWAQCSLTLPTEMKRCPFPEVWVQRQRYHPSWLALNVPACVLQRQNRWSWLQPENYFYATVMCQPQWLSHSRSWYLASAGSAR